MKNRDLLQTDNDFRCLPKTYILFSKNCVKKNTLIRALVDPTNNLNTTLFVRWSFAVDQPSKFERKTSVALMHADRDALKTKKKSGTWAVTSVRGVVSGMATVLCQEWRTQECRLLGTVLSLQKLWCCFGTLVDAGLCRVGMKKNRRC